MKRLSIDRFESIYAICEDDELKVVTIPLFRLPKDVNEGDVIIINDDNSIIVDGEETQRRRLEIARLMKKLIK